MFGKKKEESQDYRYMSNAELACKFPQIANIKIANEELTEENCKLEEANSALQEELAKYKALYEEAKNGQDTSAPTSFGTVYTDPAVLRTLEERDRLEQEVKDLKERLASFNNSTAPDTSSAAELAALKKELAWANDHIKNIENALNDERAENANLKERINNRGTKMSNEITQWEYKIENGYETIQEKPENLTKLGEQGWELAGLQSIASGHEKLIFKRPKQRDNDYGYSR